MTISDFRVEPADYHVDFKDLRAIREPVFVVEQNVPIEEEWDALDPLCHHVIARDFNHKPIGTGRLTPEHKIGRMAVIKEWRGKNVGAALLQVLIDKARELGWTEVSLNSQVSAIGFYTKFGFVSYGEEYEEAGIMHKSMKLALEPFVLANRAPGKSMTARMLDFDTSSQLIEATLQVIATAKRSLWIYSRDLEHGLYAQPDVVEALKKFGIQSRGGVAQILVQDTMAPRSQPHALLGLSQRLSSVFQFRTPIDPEDLQYPSAFIASDGGAYLFRLLDGRYEGDWSPDLPARNKQLIEHFGRVWERSRPCTEFRALGW
ncbi:MAG: GNAT family N-acetyltransferase [Arenimonas sp.]